MKVGWLIGIISLWVIGTLVAGICANAWAAPDIVTPLDTLMRPLMATSLWQGIISAIGTVFSADFWDALWQMVAWSYPFGGTFWLLIRYLLLIPLSIAVVFSIGLATIRGVSSS